MMMKAINEALLKIMIYLSIGVGIGVALGGILAPKVSEAELRKESVFVNFIEKAAYSNYVQIGVNVKIANEFIKDGELSEIERDFLKGNRRSYIAENRLETETKYCDMNGCKWLSYFESDIYFSKINDILDKHESVKKGSTAYDTLETTLKQYSSYLKRVDESLLPEVLFEKDLYKANKNRSGLFTVLGAFLGLLAGSYLSVRELIKSFPDIKKEYDKKNE